MLVLTGSAPYTRPKSWLLQVQALVHAADPDAFEAFDAPGVDPHEHLDGVAGPGGDLGGRDAGVEPPGDPGVPQVKGRFISSEASWSCVREAARTFCQTCHQVEGWMGVPFSDPEQPAVRGGASRLDMGTEEPDKLGWDWDLCVRACERRGGPAFGCSL
jgi:hypothetical protein